ncbi:hypothetical protein [Aminobacter sp. SS-2016]|uniref:hypothetical protein n=1 Tax=Aminobacter sp. Y103A TaxID=1870862 RepID=UPI00257258F9|nr:hypothetical protein [Aminobacter sp. SS-2016]
MIHRVGGRQRHRDDRIIAAAIAKAGSAENAQEVAETMRANGPWTTAIGDIGYDAKGGITRPASRPMPRSSSV